MKAKCVCLWTLVLSLLGGGMAWGADPQGPYSASGLSPLLPISEAPPPATPTPMGALDRWITYACPDCCGPIGRCGPFLSELYVRSGPSVPLEGGVFQHTLTTGWDIQGGGRLMLVNKDLDAAWAVDVSLSSISNQGQHADIVVPLQNIILPNANSNGSGVRVPLAPVTIQALDRTFVNLGFGREWWLIGQPMPGSGCGWKVGIDGGGRYGTARLELHEIQHRTDTIAGAYAALHTDYEIPFHCCEFSFGVRAEWDYTWMDILQSQNDSDLMDLNLLFTVGVRF